VSRGPLLALLLGATLAGCRTLPPAVPLAPGDPRPERLVAAAHARAQARVALRARARVRLSGQATAGFARQLLLLERPARLRVEVLGLLGQRVAVLATDGVGYDLYRAETGVVEHGAVHAAILAEVAGVPLRPEDAVALLLGDPPLPAAGAPRRALALGDGGVAVEWSAASGAARRAEFDARGRLRAFEEGLRGTTWLRAGWDEFEDAGEEGAFARRVTLDFPTSDTGAEISFEQVELNPPIDESLFRLEPVSAEAGERVSSARGE
jgi:hypothetical protein